MSHLNIRNGEAAKLYELLRDSNLQVTVARLVILGIIKQSEHELTAAQIMRHTAFRTAKISFGVVYATLNTLEKAGLIERFKLGREQGRYAFHRTL